jgi:hypothetical protein
MTPSLPLLRGSEEGGAGIEGDPPTVITMIRSTRSRVPTRTPRRQTWAAARPGQESDLPIAIEPAAGAESSPNRRPPRRRGVQEFARPTAGWRSVKPPRTGDATGPGSDSALPAPPALLGGLDLRWATR